MENVKLIAKTLVLSIVVLTGIASILGTIPITPVTYVPIEYATSCGQGAYTFEPYPAVIEPGLSTNPPSMPTSANASCLSPGSTFTATPLQERYSDLITVTKLEFVIYHLRVLDNSNIGKYWHPKQDPEYFELSFTYNNGQLTSTIPHNITGIAPTAADIRMTYTNNNGNTRTVLFEDGRGELSDHKLFFVPRYEVVLATKRIDIGFNFLDQTVRGHTFQQFSTLYPRGMERYCKIRSANIHDDGFPGTARFWDYGPSTKNPNHGYYVEMPATRTGHFEFNYQLVCPRDLKPSGSELFTSWGILGAHSGSDISGGLPNYTSVSVPDDLWHVDE